jgi:F0F1-type ATP synthase membrane subunit b/b'
MLAVGVASGIGYAVIGLPNVLVLAVLAGLLEAVPMIGPVLAAVPALAAAVSLGVPTMLAVVAFAMFVQLLENNVLVPRVMGGTVGTSPLVGLVAVLAFGTLYGVLGVFIAIPITAVIQVIVDRVVINREAAAPANPDSQLESLSARVRNVRQQLRVRLRARETRMGIDPDTADHIVDAADQQIEGAVEHIGKVISATQDQLTRLPPESRESIVEELDEATQHLEQAVDQMARADESDGANGSAEEPSLDILRDAAESVEGAMGRVQAVVALEEQESPAPEPVAIAAERPAQPPRMTRRRE